jgi:hypothetical protein
VIGVSLMQELHRPGKAGDIGDDGVKTLRERVTARQAAEQGKVRQADDDVGNQQAAEGVQGPPPGPAVADRVELAPVGEQGDQQQGGEDGRQRPERGQRDNRRQPLNGNGQARVRDQASAGRATA